MPPVNTTQVQHITWDVDYKALERYAEKVDRTVSQVVRAQGFLIQALAVKNAPWDTGTLRNSIYVRTDDQNRIPPLDTTAERVELPRPDNEKQVVVGPSVDYGLYVEMGTRVMGPRPYLAQAVESQRQSFITAISRAFRD